MVQFPKGSTTLLDVTLRRGTGPVDLSDASEVPANEAIKSPGIDSIPGLVGGAPKNGGACCQP